MRTAGGLELTPVEPKQRDKVCCDECVLLRASDARQYTLHVCPSSSFAGTNHMLHKAHSLTAIRSNLFVPIDEVFLRQRDGNQLDVCVLTESLTTSSVRSFVSGRRLINAVVSSSMMLSWASDLVKALSQLHDIGYLHDNLRSESLVIDESSSCLRIADIWHTVDVKTAQGASYVPRVSRKYWAPEQLTHGVHSRAANMWQLGLTLLEIATDVCFDELQTCVGEVCRNSDWDVSHELSKLPNDYRELSPIIQACLRPDASKRLCAAELLPLCCSPRDATAASDHLSRMSSVVPMLIRHHISTASSIDFLSTTLVTDPQFASLGCTDRSVVMDTLRHAWYPYLMQRALRSGNHVWGTYAREGPMRATPMAVCAWLPPSADLSEKTRLPVVAKDSRERWKLASRQARFHDNLLALFSTFCDSPMWFLLALSVHPSHTSQGWGGRLLKRGTMLADHQGVPCGAIVFTQLGVKFFSKHGFKIITAVTLYRKEMERNSFRRTLAARGPAAALEEMGSGAPVEPFTVQRNKPQLALDGIVRCWFLVRDAASPLNVRNAASPAMGLAQPLYSVSQSVTPASLSNSPSPLTAPRNVKGTTLDRLMALRIDTAAVEAHSLRYDADDSTGSFTEGTLSNEYEDVSADTFSASPVRSAKRADAVAEAAAEAVATGQRLPRAVSAPLHDYHIRNGPSPPSPSQSTPFPGITFRTDKQSPSSSPRSPKGPPDAAPSPLPTTVPRRSVTEPVIDPPRPSQPPPTLPPERDRSPPVLTSPKRLMNPSRRSHAELLTLVSQGSVPSGLTRLRSSEGRARRDAAKTVSVQLPGREALKEGQDSPWAMTTLSPTTQAKVVELLNSQPRSGLAQLRKEMFGVKPYSDDGASPPPYANDVMVARFLHETNGISKKSLGEVIGATAERQLCECFIDYLSFYGLPPDIALRRLLFTFRLPSEAQQIDRVIEVFSDKFVKDNPDDKWGQSLNTDAHHGDIEEKMSKDQFVRNVRGNSKHEEECFTVEFLSDMYDRICDEEIKTREDAVCPWAIKKGWLTVKVREVSARSSEQRSLSKLKRCWWALQDDAQAPMSYQRGLSGRPRQMLMCFKDTTSSKPIATFVMGQLLISQSGGDVKRSKKSATYLFTVQSVLDPSEAPSKETGSHVYHEWQLVLGADSSDRRRDWIRVLTLLSTPEELRGRYGLAPSRRATPTTIESRMRSSSTVVKRSTKG